MGPVSAPRVSVLLPARNAEETLAAALESVAAQTFGDFELLGIDDGSTDGTAAVLEAWARRDRRVRVLRTGGVGLVAALALGLREARGELVARMDADDLSLPTRFEESVRALDAEPGWAGVGTGVEIFRDDRPPSPNLQRYGRWLSSLTSPALVFRDRFIESPLCHPSMLLRRAAVERAGGWRDGPFPEDWELWLRLMERGERLSCVPLTLHRWRDHDRRLTRADARYALERHLDLKADYLARLFPHTPLTLWGATDTGRALSHRLRARGCQVVRFVELNPKKLGQRIHEVPVIHPEELPRDGSHVLSAVAAQGARDDIRAWFTRRGFVELEHFTCVA